MFYDSTLEVFLNGMRYINPRFTYLLTSTCFTEAPAASQKSAASAAESEAAVIEDEAAAMQCQDKFYWITTLPSGERTATSCCDQTDVNVINATVCIMTDPVSSQVASLTHG